MVHKKYIKKGGKIFGPYFYETKRVNGRVVTTYLGKGEEIKSRRKLTDYFFNNFKYFLIILLFISLIFGVYITERQRISLSPDVPVFVLEHLENSKIDMSSGEVNGVGFDLRKEEYGIIVGQKFKTELVVNFGSSVLLDEIVGLPEGAVIDSVELLGELKEEEQIPEADEGEDKVSGKNEEASNDERNETEINQTGEAEAEEGSGEEAGDTDSNESAGEIIESDSDIDEGIEDEIEDGDTGDSAETETETGESESSGEESNIEANEEANANTADNAGGENEAGTSGPETSDSSMADSESKPSSPEPSVEASSSESDSGSEDISFSPPNRISLNLNRGENKSYVGEEGEKFKIIYSINGPTSTLEKTERGLKVIINSELENDNKALFYTDITSLNVDEADLKVINNNGEEIVFRLEEEDRDKYISFLVPFENQEYEIIIITNALHLNENREFVSNIYKEVIELDGDWSEEIPDTHYTRVTFETNLTSERDITVYPRTVSGQPRIEVYEVNGNEVVAEFNSLNDNEYNKVFLDGSSGAGLQGEQNEFDLRILGGSIEFEHIIDPEGGFGISNVENLTDCGVLNLPNTLYLLQSDVSNSQTCFTIEADNVTLEGQGHIISYGSSSASSEQRGVYSTYNNTAIMNVTIVRGGAFGGSQSRYGIQFSNVENGTIKDVSASNNNRIGIFLGASTNINLTNVTTNSNTQYGIAVSSSLNNYFSQITSNFNIQKGIFILSSSNNEFNDGLIDSSGQEAIFIAGAASDKNKFRNISISNTGAGFSDLRWNTAGIDDTELIGMPHVGAYSIAGLGGTILVENNNGRIKFLEAVNGSGLNLTNDIRIAQNLATVESSLNDGLNRSANVTLYNMPGGFTNPIVLRDDFDCENICYNFTDLNAGTVEFNVSYWTNYSIGSQIEIPITSCTFLDLPNSVYVLQNDISTIATCFGVGANNVTLDGQGHIVTYGNVNSASELNGIDSSFNQTHIKNITIRRGNNALPNQPRHGIKFSDVKDGSITDVNVSNNLRGIFFISSSGNNISKIISSFNGDSGIYLFSGSMNNTFTEVVSNFNNLDGVFIDAGSSNNIFSNVMTNSNQRVGIIISANSNNNTFSNLNSNLNIFSGVHVSFSKDNIFQDGLIDSSGMDAIFLEIDSTNGNKFNNISINNTSPSFKDIRWASPQIDDTYLINMSHIGRYEFIGNGGTIIVENSNGRIKFLEAVNGSGLNLTNDIRIAQNLATVESSLNDGLNRSANVTLYNMPGGFTNPIVLRDDFDCENICYNFTDLNAGTVEFNVSYWTNYSIGEMGIEIPLTQCQALNSPNSVYILQSDVSSTESCFNVTANNVTLDGQGFNIVYGDQSSGEEFYGVSSTSNMTEIRNVTIRRGAAAANNNLRYGISFARVNNGTIKDVNVSNNLRGVSFISSSGNNLFNVIANSNTQGGIFLSASNGNILENASANFNFVGVSLDSSSNNSFVNITSNSNNNHGIVIQINSNYNQFRSLTSNANLRGINIINSFANSFLGGEIKNSNQEAIFLGGSSSDGNVFESLSTTNTNPSFFDIKWNAAGIDGTRLVKMTNLKRYTFTGNGGTVIVENDNGKVRFLEAVNGTGDNFRTDIIILQNLATVESSLNDGLNRSANVTLYNIPGGFTNPIVLRDDFACGDICYNFTNLNAGTVEFNVSYWTNYSIGESAAQFSIDISPNLTSGIIWNITSPPANDEPAEGNNGNEATYYFINVSATGTNVDVYMRADGDLIYNDGGIDYIIGLGNQTYRSSTTDPNIPIGMNFPITTNFADNQIGSNLPDGSSIFLKFFLDVPSGQRAGNYNNTVEFFAVPKGVPPA